jgi:hypothetical protein
MKSPILFLVFNRPESTARVFEAIRAAQPPRLYIAADGPRASRAGESERCALTREVASAVDWPCSVSTLFRATNLGCKNAVSSAIGWFFEHENEGVILEDDCLPDRSFFRYCDELLAHYRDNPRIGLISGDNFQFGKTHGASSYYFSRYAHVWGWASWRRVWQHYDLDCANWPAFRDGEGLERIPGISRREIRYWRSIFDRVSANQIDTWDYQLVLAMWSHQMLSVLPQQNLVSNIGFGTEATHTSTVSKFANLPVTPIRFPLQHPTSLAACDDADSRTAAEMFVPPLSQRVISRLRALAQAI